MITVFYANLVYAEYHTVGEFKAQITPSSTPEVYNGAFIHTDRWYWTLFGLPGWYRADGTPYPEDQIDPRLKAWLLLLD